MGIFDWLLGERGNFLKFDDAYAISRPALWKLLRPAIEVALADKKTVWLIVHFTETFGQLQDQLDQWQCDYEVIPRAIESGFSGAESQDRRPLERSTVKLVLAALIPDLPSPSLLETDPNHELAMMVIERHPSLSHDERIARFAKHVPLKVELGYFLSLDDVVVKQMVSETTILLLKQLGLDEHQLVSSNMVTRRLDAVLKRLQASFTGDLPADSAQEWLDQNS